MILTGTEIHKEHGANRISLSGFDADRLTTNSYDLRLGRSLIRYADGVLDPRSDNKYEQIEMGPHGYRLEAGEFVLGESTEKIGSNHYVPLIHARSGIARLGLFVHVTADLIDIGSYGKTTFQLYATMPITIYPGMKIAQVTFWTPQGEIQLYDGKYNGAEGPLPSRAHLDANR